MEALTAVRCGGARMERDTTWGQPVELVAHGASEDGLVIVGYSDPNRLLEKWPWNSAIESDCGVDSLYRHGRERKWNASLRFFDRRGIRSTPGFIWTATDGMRLLPRQRTTHGRLCHMHQQERRLGRYASRLAGGQYQAAIWHPAVGGWMLKEYLLQQGVSAEDWVFNFGVWDQFRWNRSCGFGNAQTACLEHG